MPMRMLTGHRRVVRVVVMTIVVAMCMLVLGWIVSVVVAVLL